MPNARVPASLAQQCLLLPPATSAAEQKALRSVVALPRPKWDPDSSTPAIHPDSTFPNDFNLDRGYCETKDSGDNDIR
jgi:hypothetical protein